MEDLAGVQAVFCGPETVVYLKSGAVALSPQAIEEALVGLEIKVDGVARDDSVLL
jgi:hypothetical protein